MPLSAFRLAAGTLLLAHALFGCIWCQAGRSLAEAARASAQDCCCGSPWESTTPGDHHPAAPGPTKMACQVCCTYLLPDSVQMDNPLQFYGFAADLLADPLAAEDLLAVRIALDRSDGPPDSGSLPRYLAFQLLLI